MAEDNMNKALRDGGLFRVAGKVVDAEGREVEGGEALADKADKQAKRDAQAQAKEQEDAHATRAAGGLANLLRSALHGSTITTDASAASQGKDGNTGEPDPAIGSVSTAPAVLPADTPDADTTIGLTGVTPPGGRRR